MNQNVLRHHSDHGQDGFVPTLKLDKLFKLRILLRHKLQVALALALVHLTAR